MEPIHTPVADPSGTGAMYQVDETQSTRLSDEEEVLAAGDDQDDKEVRTPSPKQDHPELSHVQESAFDSSSPDLKKFDNILSLTERQLIKYLRKMSRAFVDQYFDENITHRDQTDKLVEASMSSLDRSSTTINDLYKGLNVITELLKDISNAVKDDLATNQKLNEATKTFARISSNVTEQEEATIAWMKSSTNMAWNLGSSGVELSQTALKREISSLRKDTSEIKSTMTEMYTAFQGQSSSDPLGGVTPTLALTDIPANIDKRKGIATESDDDPSKKLVKASSIVRPDPDEPVRKAEEEARLNAISNPEVIKVVREEAKKLGIHPKEAITTKAGELFKKAQDAKHKVLKKQHTKKVRKSLKLRKHKYDSYMWTISSRLKPKPITDIKIHPKTKPVVITVYRGIDDRNFDVHKPFLFGAFGISELDELREIIPKKKNTVFALPAPEQTSSQVSGRKRKHMELEPETRIPGLECNRALPENVPFVNNMVIEEPEYGIFFTDEFGDQAFQRWSDIDKVGMEAIVSYLVDVSMVKSPKNARFSMKLRKLIAEHPDQEKLKSKKVKLESLGHNMD
ncbi:hypothetical protein Tco_0946683 [Tanacetum coccineum]